MRRWGARAVAAAAPVMMVAITVAMTMVVAVAGPGTAAAAEGLAVAIDTGDLGPGRTTVVVAGAYSCGPFAAGVPDRGTIDITVQQRQGRRTVTAYGYFDPVVCDGTDQAFTATVTAVGTTPFRVGPATWSASGYVEGDGTLQHTSVPPTAFTLTR